MKRFEKVYTMPDFYDGPRGGIADFEGRPHAYASLFDESEGYTGTFLLMPVEEELFRLALEDWAIWLRWEKAHREGKTSMETHPALPEERMRHEELTRIIANRLVPVPEKSQRALAEFRPGPNQTLEVFWSLI